MDKVKENICSPEGTTSCYIIVVPYTCTFFTFDSIMITGLGELLYLEEIGQGGFGRVFKGVWRGLIVAAKEIPTAETREC